VSLNLEQFSTELADAFAAVADRERLRIELAQARAELDAERDLNRQLRTVIALGPYNRAPAAQPPEPRQASRRPSVHRTPPRGIPVQRRSLD
jgi:hypothetical protein